MIPAPVLETHDGVVVVRDDLVPGGTKRRVLPGLLVAWPEDMFVYAGPCQGYAQFALAFSAPDVGKRAVVFVPQRARRHPLTDLAERAGASVGEVPFGRASVVAARAKAFARATGVRLLDLGAKAWRFVRRHASPGALFWNVGA